MAALGGGAAYANASLSGKYNSPQAVLDYFDAQRHGDVAGMLAVATFLRGSGSANGFFDKVAVAAMIRHKQNTDLKDVKVVSVASLDANTSKVGVSMKWAGVERSASYLVRRDASQTHYLFYNTWRIVIPYTTITVNLPKQSGPLDLDGLAVAIGPSANRVEAIAGYHVLAMGKTAFYDASTKMVNGVDADPTVTLDGKVSDSVTIEAAAAIKDTMENFCDASKYYNCVGHTYSAPNDGNIWYLVEPGYPEIDYRSYVFTFTSDPTADMKLVVADLPGQVTASGMCAVTLTVDGSRTYVFKGTWTADLTWRGSAFGGTHTKSDCEAAKA